MIEKLLLVGQADHDNFGDSLIFSMYMRLLNKNQPSLEIYLWKPSDIFIKRLTDDNLTVRSLSSVSEVKTAGVRLVVLVPGGFLGCPDITDIFWQLKWIKSSYIQQALLAVEEINVPTMVHGVEIGPFLRPLVSVHVKRFLSLPVVKNIYTRNTSGKKYAKNKIDIDTEVIPDFILGVSNFYKYPDKESSSFELGLHATGKMFAGNYLAEKFLDGIGQFIENKKITSILIFSDQVAPAHHIEFIEKFISKYSQKNVRVEFKNYAGINEILKNISLCENIITSKLHVGVCGLSFGKKVVSITSHPKLVRFYKDINLQKYSINFFTSSTSSKIRLIDSVYSVTNDEYFSDMKSVDNVADIYRDNLNIFLRKNNVTR